MKNAKDLYVAVKIYGNETTGNLKVEEEEAEYVFAHIPRGKIAYVHAEQRTLNMMLRLAKKYNVPLHVAHVSLRSEVELIDDAIRKGLNVSGEVTPHHLIFSENDRERLKGQGIMKPPLATKEDVIAMRRGLRLGPLAMIATDHAPHSEEDKQRENPAFGVTGLETSLLVALQMYKEGDLSLSRLKQVLYYNPRQRFKLPKQADTYVLVDMNQNTTIHANKLESKAKSTPWDGHTFPAKIVEVVFKGQKVVDENGIIDGIPPLGKIYTPGKNSIG